MAKGPRYKVDYRRRREGKTNYKKRLNLLKSRKSRVVVRKSNRYITMELIEYNPIGDKVLVYCHSHELKKFNWKFSMKNTPAAYLTGFLFGKKCKKKNLNEGILDTGLYTNVKGSKIYSALKGAIDAGLKIPCSEEVFPDESRIRGEVISKFLKNEEMVKKFEETKSLIEKKNES